MGASKDAQEIITNAMLYMYKFEPFYAYICSQIRFRQSDEISTLGVGYANGTVELVYNPEYIMENEDMAVDLLKHECGHILHGHLAVSTPKGKIEHTVMNIAMDSYINMHLSKIQALASPPEDIILGKANSNKPYVGETHILRNGTAEELYKKLMDMLPEVLIWNTGTQAQGAEGQTDSDDSQTQNASGDDLNGNIGIDNVKEVDDHSRFGKDVSKEEASFINKAIVETAYSKSKGNVPNEVSELVQGILKSHTNVNWRKELARFTGQAIEVGRYKTITKPNKKYGYPFFGRRSLYSGDLAVAMDVSGSISDEDLLKFLGETYTIMKKTGLRVWIAQGDTEVADVSKYTRHKINNFVRNAGGGTELQPMVNAAAKKSKFIVVFTDGYAPLPKIPKGTRVIFVLTKDHDDRFAREARKVGKVAIMNG